MPKETLQSLKLKAQLTTEEVASDDEDAEEENGEDSEESMEANEGTADQGQLEALGAAVLEESHIYDFWVEVAARAEILAEVASFEANEFLGFKKEDLISFLLPVVVVDGQHRLWGANETAKSLVDEQKSEIEAAIADGQSPADVHRALMTKLSRKLPVSLLMVDDPAEHVFQFVVVNQKATQIGTALLGTIVSTSLSNEELERVADRLSKAGIKLEDSRVISYLARHHSSPFCDLVERGLQGDAKDLLPWTVLGSLANIFRKLKGGKLYHGKAKNDYANIWRQKYLASSGIVADWEAKGFKSEFEYWQQPDGPWRLVFITFWTEVRARLGTDEADESNVWGKARSSNLFNKISLTILSADFYQYLCENKRGIDSPEDVKSLIADWLTDVKPKYFGRDWKLSGVKKDSTGIRKASLNQGTWRTFFESPATWLLGVALGLSINAGGFLRAGSDPNNTLPDFASNVLGIAHSSGSLYGVALYWLLIVAAVTIMLSTVHCMISAVSFTLYRDFARSDGRASLPRARFWTALAVIVGALGYHELRSYFAANLPTLVYGAYSAQLSLFFVALLGLLAKRLDKDAAIASVCAGLGGTVLSVVLAIKINTPSSAVLPPIFAILFSAAAYVIVFAFRARRQAVT